MQKQLSFVLNELLLSTCDNVITYMKSNGNGHLIEGYRSGDVRPDVRMSVGHKRVGAISRRLLQI